MTLVWRETNLVVIIAGNTSIVALDFTMDPLISLNTFKLDTWVIFMEASQFWPKPSIKKQLTRALLLTR